ncbi:MAG: hypothetical protein KC609_16340 [Myxococcales bacterium]|nr:hypothetical protein [Myxococcales bacterium]
MRWPLPSALLVALLIVSCSKERGAPPQAPRERSTTTNHTTSVDRDRLSGSDPTSTKPSPTTRPMLRPRRLPLPGRSADPPNALGPAEFLAYLPRTTSFVLSFHGIERLAKVVDLAQLRTGLASRLTGVRQLATTIGFDPLHPDQYAQAGIDAQKPFGLFIVSGEPTLAGLFFGVKSQLRLFATLRRAPFKGADVIPLGKETTLLRWPRPGIVVVVRGRVAIVLATVGAPSIAVTTKLARTIAGLPRRDSLARDALRVAHVARRFDLWGELRPSAIRRALDERLEALPREIQRETQPWRKNMLSDQQMILRVLRGFAAGIGPLRVAGRATANALRLDWSVKIGAESWLHGLFLGPVRPVVAPFIAQPPMVYLRYHFDPEKLWQLVRRVAQSVAPTRSQAVLARLDKLLLKPIASYWTKQVAGALELAVLPATATVPPQLAFAASLTSDAPGRDLAPLLRSLGLKTRTSGGLTVYRIPLARVFTRADIELVFAHRTLLVATDPATIDAFVATKRVASFLAGLPKTVRDACNDGHSVLNVLQLGLFGRVVELQLQLAMHTLAASMRQRWLAVAATRDDPTLVAKVRARLAAMEKLGLAEVRRRQLTMRALYQRFGAVVSMATVTARGLSGQLIWQVRSPSFASLIQRTVLDLFRERKLENEYQRRLQAAQNEIRTLLEHRK